MAFAPRENPEIVLAVLLEGGEHGGLAAPTARDVIKAYFDKKTRLSKLAQPSLALIRRPGQCFKTAASLLPYLGSPILV